MSPYFATSTCLFACHNSAAINDLPMMGKVGCGRMGRDTRQDTVGSLGMALGSPLSLDTDVVMNVDVVTSAPISH